MRHNSGRLANLATLFDIPSHTTLHLGKEEDLKPICLLYGVHVTHDDTFVDVLKTRYSKIYVLLDAFTATNKELRHEFLKRYIDEKHSILPLTVESLAFELIDTYKDEKFKSVLAIAKNRPGM